MTKPNKTAIAAKLEEWAKLQKQRLSIEAKRDKELDPHVTRFENATASINSAAQLKLDALAPKVDSLAKEIEAALLAGVDEKSGKIALSQVAAGNALAEVKSKEGARVVDPETYLASTPAPKRTSKFWAGLKVVLAPAEAFLGKVKLDAMAEKPKTYKVDLKLSE